MSTKKIPTIADQWALFSKVVFGHNKPSYEQYCATRRTFYSGVAAMQALNFAISDLELHESFKAFSALYKESEAFFDEMIEETL